MLISLTRFWNQKIDLNREINCFFQYMLQVAIGNNAIINLKSLVYKQTKYHMVITVNMLHIISIYTRVVWTRYIIPIYFMII